MGQEQKPAEDQSGQADNTGQPAETEKAPEFQPITSQADLNKVIADRVARERGKFSDYDDLKSKAARLDQIDEANKTELQKITDAKSQIEQERDKEKAEALRLRVALEEGVAKDDLQFLVGGDEESVRALAKRLAVKPEPGVGAHVPDEGRQPKKPGSIAEQIAAAETEGDKARVAQLKTQQMFPQSK